ncbi:MAG: tripartite tricarboxylate transporter substrate binding protein [Betaproteobacteria bacterium]|nr:tripartite tricarboxylate transporter substrate binding protein [Betaproteobacteria bacterium]
MTKQYSAIAPLFLASLAVVVSSGVFAQSAADYPHKPIRVIVPFSPGGGSDVIARLVGARLSERLGQTVVVDNRPAAAGIIGTDIVAKASPDGYTLLLVTASHAVSAKLATRLPYDPIKDFSPITEVIASPFGALLQPSLPAATMKEFIAYAKANPGKLNYGSSGPGSSPHLSTELLMSMAGLKMTHVPYKGVAQFVTAQLGGEIQFSLSNMFSTMGHWKAGRLRLVAHTNPKRLEAFPDLPTVAESGVPGYEASLWYGFTAPARTPRPIIDKLYREITAIARAPDVRRMLVSQGNEVITNSPAEFAQVIAAAAEKWGTLGKRLGVKLD